MIGHDRRADAPIRASAPAPEGRPSHPCQQRKEQQRERQQRSLLGGAQPAHEHPTKVTAELRRRCSNGGRSKPPPRRISPRGACPSPPRTSWTTSSPRSRSSSSRRRPRASARLTSSNASSSVARREATVVDSAIPTCEKCGRPEYEQRGSHGRRTHVCGGAVTKFVDKRTMAKPRVRRRPKEMP